MSPRIILSFIAVFSFPILLLSAPLTVRVLGSPAVQKVLQVEINSPGEVAVENPLALQTQIIKGQGLRTTNLGSVKEPGFYSFRFFTATESQTVLVPVLGTTGYVSKPVERPRVQEEAILKFMRLHTNQTTMKAAWSAWPLRDEMVANVVKVTAAGTLIIVCPFEVVACGYAAETTLDLGLDLFIAFEVFHAGELAKKNLLTAAEVAQIKTAFQNAKLVKSLFSAKDSWDVAFAAADYLMDLVSNKDVKIGVGLMKDQASKTHTLILMVEKLKKP